MILLFPFPKPIQGAGNVLRLPVKLVLAHA
jgi:hypothetical protein